MVATKRTRLAFGEKHVETYKKLGDLLGKLSNRDQFLLAMSWGFRNNTRVEDFKRSDNGARIDYMNDQDLALIAAIHLAATDDPDSLADVDKGFDVAEQFAEGGILLLQQMMDGPGDFSRTFAAEVKTELDSVALPS